MGLTRRGTCCPDNRVFRPAAGQNGRAGALFLAADMPALNRSPRAAGCLGMAGAGTGCDRIALPFPPCQQETPP